MTMINLENLTTERRNQATFGLDEMTVAEACQKMNAEDQKVAQSVEKELPSIEKVIQQTDMVIGLIAGGEEAMTVAVEGAEDSVELGRQDLIDLKLTENDMVIGIAASGRTPYVIGALDYANEIGATTGTIACNKQAEISKHASFPIEVDCGPEFLTGSTRLKSGTAQKLILNMISTISMVGIGKVYNNLMVDVKPTNDKLVERAKRIIMQATEADYETAADYFEKADQNVKLAIVMLLTNSEKEEAAAKLVQSEGFVKGTLEG